METKEEKEKQLIKEERKWRENEVLKSIHTAIVAVIMTLLFIAFNFLSFNDLDWWKLLVINIFILLTWFVVQAILVSLHKDKFKRTIQLSNEVYKWLSETICENRKPYIVRSKNKKFVYDWVQNKQLARELLTHPNIKGSLIDADVERIAPTLFFYPKDNLPLELAKDRPKPSIDSDILAEFLATLQPVDL